MHNTKQLNSNADASSTDTSTTDCSPNKGTYLCFDFGQKRIGVAVGHSDTKTANPMAVIRNINGRPEWDHMDKLIKEWKPTGLVVGLPLHENPEPETSERETSEPGVTATDIQPTVTHSSIAKTNATGHSASNNQQLLLSAAFSKKLRNRYKIPVYRCDERYSSIEAARLLAENRSRGKRKKVGREDLDKVAAAIILNQWFNNEF